MKRYLLIILSVLFFQMGIANAAVKGYTAYGFMPLTSSEGVFSTKLVKFNTTEPANVNEVASFD